MKDIIIAIIIVIIAILLILLMHMCIANLLQNSCELSPHICVPDFDLGVPPVGPVWDLIS